MFEVAKGSNGTWTESAIYTPTGYQAPFGVIFDSHGNLYSFDYQYALEYTSSTTGPWTQSILYTFTGTTYAVGNPVFDSAGNLYGVTEFVSNSEPGSIFKLTPGSGGSWTETTLYTFTDGSDGGAPNTPILDSAGDIYVAASQGGLTCGIAYYGASEPCGTIFELSPTTGGGWRGSTLYEFAPGPTDGAFPYAGLVTDNVGNFYGTTEGGGASGDGAVYKVSSSKGKWVSSLLYSFTGTDGDGSSPSDRLVLDSAGNLYGTTEDGGQYGGGNSFQAFTIFEWRMERNDSL